MKESAVKEWTFEKRGCFFKATEEEGLITVKTTHDGTPYSSTTQREDAPSEVIANVLAFELLYEIERPYLTQWPAE